MMYHGTFLWNIKNLRTTRTNPQKIELRVWLFNYTILYFNIYIFINKNYKYNIAFCVA